MTRLQQTYKKNIEKKTKSNESYVESITFLLFRFDEK